MVPKIATMAVKDAPLAHLAAGVKRAVKIPVIGIGGIMTGMDALEYLVVGAKAVQVGTANFIDPAAAGRIVDEIAAYCESHGIAKVADLVGTLKA